MILLGPPSPSLALDFSHGTVPHFATHQHRRHRHRLPLHASFCESPTHFLSMMIRTCHSRRPLGKVQFILHADTAFNLPLDWLIFCRPTCVCDGL
jgi:hypothetical protein